MDILFGHSILIYLKIHCSQTIPINETVIYKIVKTCQIIKQWQIAAGVRHEKKILSLVIFSLLTKRLNMHINTHLFNSRYYIGHIISSYTEYEPWEGYLGIDSRDDDHCINTGGGDTEVTSLVCSRYRLVIHRNLKQKASWYKCQK